MVEHLEHGAAGRDHQVRGQAFAQQVLPGDGAVRQVHVRHVIDDPPVDLFRHPHVEASVAGLHVEDRNTATLGRNRRQTRIGVPQDQHGFWLHLRQHPVSGDDHLSDGLRRGRPGRVEIAIRCAQFEIIEEDLVQLVVVVLPGVDDDMFGVPIQGRHHA